METSRKGDNGAAGGRWEWLPLIAALILAALYWHAAPGSALSRFSFFVGLGLIPGILWKLAGRRPWSLHRVCFALALILFVLNNPGLRPDGGTLARVAERWPLAAAGMFVAASQPIWGMLRIQRLLADSGVAIGKYEALKLCLAGAFFNMFLPGSTGGDAYRVYAIARGYSTRLAPAIASVTLDRFLGLPSLILAVVLGMIVDYEFFRSSHLLSGLIPFISAAGAVCLALVAYLALAGKRRRRPGGAGADGRRERKRGWAGRIHDMVATNVKRPATLPLALFYGFVSHLASISACMIFGMALGVEGVPGERYFLIVPLAMAINSIPGAPGGVGQGELAMATLLGMASPDHGNAQMGVMIMLLFRLSNIVVGILGGVCYALDKTAAADGGADRRRENVRGMISREYSEVSGEPAGLFADMPESGDAPVDKGGEEWR